MGGKPDAVLHRIGLCSHGNLIGLGCGLPGWPRPLRLPFWGTSGLALEAGSSPIQDPLRTCPSLSSNEAALMILGRPAGAIRFRDVALEHLSEMLDQQFGEDPDLSRGVLSRRPEDE